MINHQDLSHFGAAIHTVSAGAGTVCWKLVEARHADPNREFGGDQHVYIEALDENGQKLRGVQAQVEQGDQVHTATLDKSQHEPGTNWPLWKGTRVFVSMLGAPSERVGPLHTEMSAYKEGDWHHHTWYLVFQRQLADGAPIVEPEPVPETGAPEDDNPAEPIHTGPVSLDPSTLEQVRHESWRQVQVAFNRHSSFADYARRRNLGAPLTNEYDVGGYRAQGFCGGIVYARIGDWNNIEHVDW